LNSVWFFQFQAYKTKTEPVGFFKILIGFFHGSIFSIIFSGFLGLIGFSVFFLPLEWWIWLLKNQVIVYLYPKNLNFTVFSFKKIS
jgi:hypothetical protein